jgi:IS5 family transposase
MVITGEPSGQNGIFGNDLATMLDPNQPLYRLAQRMPWNDLVAFLAKRYATNGRPSVPLRRMIGLTILKHLFDLSDEALVSTWQQNPYWQFFCGESHFQWVLPCDPSEMTRFRKRIGEEGCERILKASLEVQAAPVDVEERVVIDSTVQEKNITYPTFAKLDAKVAERCCRIAEREGIVLRQTYARTLPKLRIQARTHRHKNPKVRAKARKAERRIRTIARRLLRDLLRKMTPDQERRHAATLAAMGVVVRQTATPGSERMHSLHEPGVVCIAKGKPHKPYEFGTKVSIAVDPATGLVVGAHAMPGRQHDRASVPETLAQVTRLTGQVPKRAICDLGYRGKQMEGETRIITPATLTGTTGSTRKRLRRLLRRRQVVEATIGRMKALHGLGRNRLAGTIGDRLNVLLAAAGNNFRIWLRLFCVYWESTIESFILATWALLLGSARSATGPLARG